MKMYKPTRTKNFDIPLKKFEKLEFLTPSQFKYLEDCANIIKIRKGNPKLLEKIGTLLTKPKGDDPIIDKKLESNWDKLYPKKHKK
jgi:hypothetical protein